MRSAKIRLPFLLLLFLPLACQYDHGIDPVFSKIAGRVIFVGEMPQNTDQVRVAVAVNFPPTDISELLTSEPLPKGVDTVAYEILVPYGDYQAVGVIWKAKNESWSLTDILGIYSDVAGFLPKSVQITPENPVADSVDIIADYRLVTKGAHISGRITFLGDWPEETEIVAVAAFREEPRTILDLLNPENISGFGLVPKGVPTYDYRIAVAPGTYKYIAVFWVQEIRQGEFPRFAVIGVYEDAQEPGSPGAVTVELEETATGIDITADFGLLADTP
jgi:hypothetical protein